MYGGSPLNRLSWLRTSHSFLNAVVTVPSTKWLLFKAGEPLVASSASSKPYLIYLSTDDVKPFLGPEPFFGQGKKAGDLVVEKDGEEHSHHSPTEAARHLGLPVVFLGVHEPHTEDSTSALPSSEFKDPQEAIKRLEGAPYFAIDVADLEYSSERLREILDATSAAAEGKSLSWSEPRALMSVMDPVTAGIFASARSLVDWNQRNKVLFSMF